MVLALIESYPDWRDKHRNRLKLSGSRRCFAYATNLRRRAASAIALKL
jgi:hypothetical protein